MTEEFTNLLTEISDKTQDLLNNIQIGETDYRYIKCQLEQLIDGLKTLDSWI